MVNWESFLAFNNAFGLSNVPTGAIINSSGATAGGTITAGNQTIIPLPYPWDNGPIYGNISGSAINCDPVTGAPCPIMSVDRNLKTPHVWNWTLGLQHSFTPNLSLELSYVGNHGGRTHRLRGPQHPPRGCGAPPSSNAPPIPSRYNAPPFFAPPTPRAAGA